MSYLNFLRSDRKKEDIPNLFDIIPQMEKKELRIVFMGTPEFAEHILRRLVEDQYNIIGVVTMPDKPMGRHGSVLQSSPVKKYAVEQGIPVLQPERLKDPLFIEQLRALRADLQIVVAFRMLPEVVWSMPPLGTFNLHASLLPQYRGAAPINWAIINGDKETGVTTFFLKHEIDTGDIIHQERIPILPTDNVGTLHDKLMELGADLTVRTLDDILAGNVRPIPQSQIPADELRPAPKIFKDTCRMRPLPLPSSLDHPPHSRRHRAGLQDICRPARNRCTDAGPRHHNLRRPQDSLRIHIRRRPPPDRSANRRQKENGSLRLPLWHKLNLLHLYLNCGLYTLISGCSRRKNRLQSVKNDILFVY